LLSTHKPTILLEQANGLFPACAGLSPGSPRVGFDQIPLGYGGNFVRRKETMMVKYEVKYEVVEISDGQIVSTISGMGRNKGTWDTCHSRSAAYRHAKALKEKYPERTFKVVSFFG